MRINLHAVAISGQKAKSVAAFARMRRRRGADGRNLNFMHVIAVARESACTYIRVMSPPFHLPTSMRDNVNALTRRCAPSTARGERHLDCNRRDSRSDLWRLSDTVSAPPSSWHFPMFTFTEELIPTMILIILITRRFLLLR